MRTVAQTTAAAQANRCGNPRRQDVFPPPLGLPQRSAGLATTGGPSPTYQSAYSAVAARPSGP
ncbi:MAG: hypothetical protein ACLQNE_04295, partial [Thermoguttaceae bacterium]